VDGRAKNCFGVASLSLLRDFFEMLCVCSVMAGYYGLS